MPDLTDTQAGLEECAAAMAAGTGPVAIDTERASGYRYGQRAFLVQLKREGSGGIWLIDPEALNGLEILNEALRGVEWILHAAHQDLPCLHEQGMWPDKLFDTELAGRLAGFDRVGLAALLERELGITLAKEHSAADWSVRPLSEDMRLYAALDVEFLIELREKMIAELDAQDKIEIARQEFEEIRTRPLPGPRRDPWRRTSGIHSLRSPQKLAIVRSLWEARDDYAREQDVSPGRLLPDSAITAAAVAEPSSIGEMLKNKKFNGRAASKEAKRWFVAIQDAKTLAAEDPDSLPPMKMKRLPDEPPKHWNSRDPYTTRQYETVRRRLRREADRLSMPSENLLAPSIVRDICSNPPKPITPESVTARLEEAGARPWQVEKTSAVITVALLDPDPEDPHSEN